MRDHYLAHARRAPKPLSDEARREKETKEKQDHAAMIQRATSWPPGWAWETKSVLTVRETGERVWMLLQGWIAPLTSEDLERRRKILHHVPDKQRIFT